MSYIGIALKTVSHFSSGLLGMGLSPSNVLESPTRNGFSHTHIMSRWQAKSQSMVT